MKLDSVKNPLKVLDSENVNTGCGNSAKVPGCLVLAFIKEQKKISWVILCRWTIRLLSFQKQKDYICLAVFKKMLTCMYALAFLKSGFIPVYVAPVLLDCCLFYICFERRIKHFVPYILYWLISFYGFLTGDLLIKSILINLHHHLRIHRLVTFGFPF